MFKASRRTKGFERPPAARAHGGILDRIDSMMAAAPPRCSSSDLDSRSVSRERAVCRPCGGTLVARALSVSRCARARRSHSGIMMSHSGARRSVPVLEPGLSGMGSSVRTNLRRSSLPSSSRCPSSSRRPRAGALLRGAPALDQGAALLDRLRQAAVAPPRPQRHGVCDRHHSARGLRETAGRARGQRAGGDRTPRLQPAEYSQARGRAGRGTSVQSGVRRRRLLARIRRQRPGIRPIVGEIAKGSYAGSRRLPCPGRSRPWPAARSRPGTARCFGAAQGSARGAPFQCACATPTAGRAS